MSRKTIINCDICGIDIGQNDGYFTTMDGKDICVECMEKLVAEYFSRGTIIPEEKEKKYEEILKSASAKEPLPSKKKDEIKMVPVEQIESRGTGRKFDAGAAQALRDAGWTVTAIAKELGCSQATVYNNTHPGVPRKAKPNEWNEDDIKRLGGTDPESVKEVM